MQILNLQVMSLERSPEHSSASKDNLTTDNSQQGQPTPMDVGNLANSQQNSASNSADFIAEPPLDPSEQKPIAHSILWTLLDSPAMQPYLLGLLSARDFNGLTPFMFAVSGRAYSAAIQLLLIMQRVAKQSASAALAPFGGDPVAAGLRGVFYGDLYKRTLESMLYPRGSLPDHSPLYMLCSNDTCSFTWTGEEHINQVRFLGFLGFLGHDLGIFFKILD